MNKELKQKWLEALRGNSYVQGSGQLRNTVEDGTCTHCCLGVLADLVDPEGWDVGRKFDDGEADDIWNSDSFCYLNENATDSIILDKSIQRSLAAINDHGTKFSEIANWIEKNVDAK